MNQQKHYNMEGKIIRLISNDYTVLAHNKRYVCKCRGLFRNNKIKPLVGDNVVFDDINNYILEIKDRKNSLLRPQICNIDQAFIITSTKEPNFSTNLLDKFLIIIEYNNITPIICFTKLDLLNKDELSKLNEYIKYYKKIGYTVLLNTDYEELKKLFKSKITVFTGQTGSGKSTLLNKIDPKLNLKTNTISKALGRGKHTTTFVELLEIDSGLIADTPGFSSLEFIGMSKQDIRDSFIEFNDYKEKCKYRDCMHHKEDDCFIKELVKNKTIISSRYENYINFIEKG